MARLGPRAAGFKPVGAALKGPKYLLKPPTAWRETRPCAAGCILGRVARTASESVRAVVTRGAAPPAGRRRGCISRRASCAWHGGALPALGALILGKGIAFVSVPGGCWLHKH